METITCACGSTIQKRSHSAHLSTKKHLDYVARQNGAAPQPATLKELTDGIRAAAGPPLPHHIPVRFALLRDSSPRGLAEYFAANRHIHRKIIVECDTLENANALEAACLQNQVRCAIYKGVGQARMQALGLFTDGPQAVLACVGSIPGDIGDTFCRMESDVPRGKYAAGLAQACKKWKWVVLPQENGLEVVRKLDPSAFRADGTPGPQIEAA